MKILLRIMGVIASAAISSYGQNISSPDGNVVVNVTAPSGNLSYSVTYRGVTVIETSPLGLTVNHANIGTGVAIGSSAAYGTNETFVSRSGIHAMATNWYQGQIIAITHTASGIFYYLNVRVYNHGVSFRYEFTDAATKNITAETSNFVIPPNSMIWYQTANSTYETYYRGTNISLLPVNSVMGPPATIQLSGTNGFVALTESTLGVFGNPYLTKVAGGGTGRQLQVTYPINQDGTTGVLTAGAINTPWNVIMIGADLNMIINNDLVESLAPAPSPALFPQGTATSWATSGRSVWDWLQPQPGGITYTNAMTNSLWAARLGYEYNTIDSGWSSWNGGNPWPQVQQVVNFS
ncbi:MAG TPA: glycoside hydrolase family 97 N-terminal domain-containing protein, partial [Verrucomicrobiae bacterium]